MKNFSIDCAIIDDEIVASHRLKYILDKLNSVKVVGVFNKYQDALDNLMQIQPGVLFLDIELDKNHTAFELIDQLHSNCYCPQIILITAYEHYSIKAIKMRVFDYLVKPIDIDELRDALRRLNKYIQDPFNILLDNTSSLSNREIQVLELVLQGKTSREIACILFVSKSTIDTHRKNILRKTRVKSFQELMRLSHV